ncbi:MAG: 30S ribosomal protein S18 [Rickettsiales bacterium]|nr:30S ribosomal protein S18 [Rickettsiales bacterium]
MRRNNMTTKKRICPLHSVGVELLDYKNLKLLEQFVSERGKILPSRITGVSAKKQRLLRNAISNARALALLPYETM